MALEQRPDGSVFIFHHGYQYRREPDGSWTKRTYNGWKQVSVRRARRLEHANQHRDNLKPVQRSPRTVTAAERTTQSGNSIIRFPRRKQSKQQRINSLVEEVLALVQYRKEARVQIGHACIALKRLVGHGHWERYFKLTIAPCGMKLRTCVRYMELARKQAVISKTANMTVFPPAVSKRAREMEKTRKQAEAAEAAARQHEPKRRALHFYRLPLRMPAAEHAAMDKLRKRPDWRSRVEPEIRSHLMGICGKYGISTKKTEGGTAS
jgi:hypothetical protein